MNKKDEKGKGVEYHIDIEGTIFEWNDDTISTQEIADLGGWDHDLGVIMIDKKTNTEETLEPGEEVELRPGLGFSKKIRFKRGNTYGKTV